MRKLYWFLMPVVFCLGIAAGALGYNYLDKYYWPANGQPAQTSAQPGDNQVSPAQNILPGQSDTTGQIDSTGNNGTAGETGSAGDSQANSLDQAEKDKIIADYKQAVGILFDAWKVKDIDSFRTVLARAYTGEIMESHVKKAEKYLKNGVGLYVSKVDFDTVDVQSADKYSATVDAVYRYTVRDYDLDEKYPYGEEINHFVHVRVNLVKLDSKWLITSETVV